MVRRHAALALGRIGDRSGTAVLLDMLADPDSTVQADVAFALGLLADPTATSRLRQVILDPSPATAATGQAEGVAALARIGGRAAAQVFIELLGRSAALAGSATVPHVVRRALAESWRLGPAAPVAQIARFATAPDPEARWRSIYSLGRLHGRGAPEVLVAGTDDSLPAIRAVAVRELTLSFADSAGIDRKALSARVQRLTADPDPQVRIAALRALGTYRSPDLASAAMALAADRDPNVRVQVLATLGELGGPEARVVLAGHAREGGFAHRRQALLSLAAVSPADALPAAQGLLAESDWRLRAVAAEALGIVGSDSATASLLRLLQASDGRVVAAAFAALAETDSARASNMARTLLRHADPLVRSLAATRLGSRSGPPDLPILIDAYGHSLGDPIADARIAIVIAAGRIAANDPNGPGPATDAFARRYPACPDYLVRRTATEFFPSLAARWGPWAPVSTGLGLGDYRDIARRLLWPAEHDGIVPGVVIETDRGSIGITLLASDAPLTVNAFVRLVERGYFDRGAWHRVVPGFVAQDGDPRGDGGGGPGFALRDELNRNTYQPGTVGMALDGPDTGGSQFFITLSPQPHLDGVYTVFGRVDSGMEALTQIVQGDRIRRVRLR